MAAGPLLVVLTGPSGAGKDSVRARLKSLGRPYAFIVTTTTRPRRAGEQGGEELTFVSRAQFERLLERGGLLEHAVVYGQRYGVPRAPVQKALARGEDVVLRTDVQGARHIKSVAPAAITIFIAPPSEEELRRRLLSRGGDSAQQQALRLRLAQEEMASASEFDHVVINDDLERCTREIEDILARERARPGSDPIVLQ
ncbi:MAG: guanylate kinase [Dehalococcoidia bacterium]|nr:guanylate kinase [Dehalococcoidia bacterium]